MPNRNNLKQYQRNPYHSENTEKRIKQATCLKDLIVRVKYASARNNNGERQELGNAKTLYDLVRDQKAIAESIISIDDKVLKLLREGCQHLSGMAVELQIERRSVELALGRLKSSGYHIIGENRIIEGSIVRHYTLKRF